MLGHVKPPTVTKEEIEKSGLETIKPAMLAAYESSGKIAASCTERVRLSRCPIVLCRSCLGPQCLICLDDYEADDDVRVMTCRHAFHKGCVDTWLQTGKNNCPACRTTVCCLQCANNQSLSSISGCSYGRDPCSCMSPSRSLCLFG